MTVRKTTLLALSAILLSACSTGVKFSSKEPVDWTPILKSWENGCEKSPAMEIFSKNIAIYSPESKSLLKIGEILLPKEYEAVLGPIQLTEQNFEDDAHSIFEIEATNSFYYGIPIKKFIFYRGHSTDYIVDEIVFDAPFEAVKEKLKDVDYQAVWSEMDGEVKAVLYEKNGEARLSCL